MTAKGYCTAGDVASFLSRTFTAEQEEHCESLIERAETRIDTYTGRGWLGGAVTDEAFYINSRKLYLRYAPVATVDAITGRAYLGETETALTVDEDYEVRDLEAGLVVLEYPGSYDRVLVAYTPVDTVPGDIQEAIIELVATWMQPHLMNGMHGVDSFTLPDLSVKFSRNHVQQGMPSTVVDTLDLYRYVVHA